MFSENKLTSISNELIYFNIREGSLYRLIRSYSLLKTSSELFQDKERSITQIHKCQQHITDEITEQISYDDTNRMNSNQKNFNQDILLEFNDLVQNQIFQVMQKTDVSSCLRIQLQHQFSDIQI